MDVAQSQVVQLPKLRVSSGKTPIPVVKHVLRDEPEPTQVFTIRLLQIKNSFQRYLSFSLLKTLRTPPTFDLDKVVRLFVDPHSVKFTLFLFFF